MRHFHVWDATWYPDREECITCGLQRRRPDVEQGVGAEEEVDGPAPLEDQGVPVEKVRVSFE